MPFKNIKHLPIFIVVFLCLSLAFFYFLDSQKTKHSGRINNNNEHISSEYAPKNSFDTERNHDEADVAPLPRISRKNDDKTPAFRELQRQMDWHKLQGNVIVTSENKQALLFPPRLSVTAARLEADGSISTACFHDPEKLERHVDGVKPKHEIANF